MISSIYSKKAEEHVIKGWYGYCKKCGKRRIVNRFRLCPECDTI